MAGYDGRITWIAIGVAIVVLLALVWWGGVYEPPEPEGVQSEADRFE